MHSDRNLINRKNVKEDISAAANPCRWFFQLEVESRVVAAASKVLEMNSLDKNEKPTKNGFLNGENGTREEKKNYLRKIATAVVDNYIVDQERNRNIIRCVQVKEHD